MMHIYFDELDKGYLDNNNIVYAIFLEYLGKNVNDKIFVPQKNKKALIKWSDRENLKSAIDMFEDYANQEVSILTDYTNVIIDLDDCNEEQFNAFIKKYDINTFTVKTRRGYHLYFKSDIKYKKSIKSSCFKSDNIDVDVIVNDKSLITLPINDGNKCIINEVPFNQMSTKLKEVLKELEVSSSFNAVNTALENQAINNNVAVDVEALHQVIKSLDLTGYDEYYKVTLALARLSNNYDSIDFDSLSGIYSTDSKTTTQLYNQASKESQYNNNMMSCNIIANIYYKQTNKFANFFSVKDLTAGMMNYYNSPIQLQQNEYITSKNIKDMINDDIQLLVASAGSGKTTAVINYALENNKRVLLIEPTNALSSNIDSKYIDTTIYDHTNPVNASVLDLLNDDLVSVMSVQQFVKLKELNVNKYDLIVFDEIHIYSSYANISSELEQIIYSAMYSKEFSHLYNKKLLVTASAFNLPRTYKSVCYLKELNKKINVIRNNVYTPVNSPKRKFTSDYITTVITSTIQANNLTGKTLVFTEPIKLERLDQVKSNLEENNITCDVVSSDSYNLTSKAYQVINNTKFGDGLVTNKSDLASVTIATSILNVGVDLSNNEFDNIIIIDVSDINYIVQAINRVRNKEANVYLFMSDKKHNEATYNFYLPKLDIKDLDISKRALFTSDSLLLEYSQDSLHAYLKREKVANDFYKYYCKFHLAPSNILAILEKLQVQINMLDNVVIDYVGEESEVDEVAYIGLDVKSAVIQLNQKYKKYNKNHDYDFNYMKDKYEFTKLKDICPKSKSNVNKLIDTLIIKTQYSFNYLKNIIEAVFNDGIDLAVSDSKVLLNTVFDKYINEDRTINDELDQYVGVSYSRSEFKEIVNKISRIFLLDFDKITMTSKVEFIKNLGYKIETKTVMGIRSKKLVKI